MKRLKFKISTKWNRYEYHNKNKPKNRPTVVRMDKWYDDFILKKKKKQKVASETICIISNGKVVFKFRQNHIPAKIFHGNGIWT